MHVLIVDDEPDLLESLELALGDRYAISTASTGREALDVLATTSVDVMILDLMMPVMGGEELLAELAARHVTVPVVVVSAVRDLDDTCARLGVAHFLQKPYRLSTLLAEVEAALAARALA